MKFWIISPSYRSKNYYAMHFGSVNAQINKNFKHIFIIDDCLDEELDEAKKLATSKTEILPIKNKKGGCLNSHIEGVKLAVSLGAKEDDVVVHLDGDDWFFHPHIFDILENFYKAGAEATFGNYIPTDLQRSICSPPKKIDRKNLNNWWFSHLRTFRLKYFLRIKDEDFKDDNGQIFEMAADVAIMTPIIEMIGIDKIKFIQYPNLVYNRFNTNNEDKVDAPLQQKTGVILSKRKAYEELKNESI